MAATPTKVCKRGRKPKQYVRNNNCRFCGVSFTSAGGRASFENLFSPSGREETRGLVLAECCSSIGFSLTRNETLSERVCRPCGRKLRNAAELYSFIEKAVSVEADEDANCADVAVDRSKRQLPTTITPERSKGKKQLIEIGEESESSAGKASSRKSLFSDSSGLEHVESSETGIIGGVGMLSDTTERETACKQDDILTSFCNIDDITGKPETQIKVLILYPNGEVTTRKTFDNSTKYLIMNLALKNWSAAANHATEATHNGGYQKSCF